MADAARPVCPPHPIAAIRDEDGQPMCSACGQIVEGVRPAAIVPRDRPGTDPTHRPDGPGSGGLRHMTYDPEAVELQRRPYTPDEVELELVDTLDRIERGASWLTTQEEKRGAAKMTHEIAFARARWSSNARSAEQRNDEALLATLDTYEEWQRLELVCRTAREGLHNLRAKLSGLQSVARSVGASMSGQLR